MDQVRQEDKLYSVQDLLDGSKIVRIGPRLGIRIGSRLELLRFGSRLVRVDSGLVIVG